MTFGPSRNDGAELMKPPRRTTRTTRSRSPTAALIYQLRELAAGRVTRVAHLEQPVFAWR